jgi:hypothetical protein
MSTHLYLSGARPIKSTPPNPNSVRSILMLFTHLRLGLPSGLSPSGFPTSNQYAVLFSPIGAICPPISFFSTDNSNYTWRRVQIMKLLLTQFSPPHSSLHSSSAQILSSPVTAEGRPPPLNPSAPYECTAYWKSNCESLGPWKSRNVRVT